MAQESNEEKIENVFALDKLPKSYDKTIESHGYQAYFNPQLKNFVCFKKTHIHDNQISKGYKLHISIDDPENDETHNFEKAWPIILKTLTEASIVDFKVVHGNGRYQPQMQGKQITIYPFKEPDRQVIPDDDAMLPSWQDVFQKLTNELTKAGIRPGILASTENIDDKEIKGSNYISYRSDSYNKDMKDPFESIQVNCKNQLDKVNPVKNIQPVLKNDLAAKNKTNLEVEMEQIDKQIIRAGKLDIYNGTQEYMRLYRNLLRENKTDDADSVRKKIDNLRQHIKNNPNSKIEKKEAQESIKVIDNNLKELDKIYNSDQNSNFNFSFKLPSFGSKS